MSDIDSYLRDLVDDARAEYPEAKLEFIREMALRNAAEFVGNCSLDEDFDPANVGDWAMCDGQFTDEMRANGFVPDDEDRDEYQSLLDNEVGRLVAGQHAKAA